nr:E3 ubiquitin protein ligase RNF146 [Hymenolepis microstoma]
MEGGSSNDCPICLQPLLQPVEIPCGHIFCYLCLKGSAFHRRKCPLCRGAITMGFFNNPNIIHTVNEGPKQDRPSSELVWYYEGRNGWWQYDERTADEIESAFSQSLPKCEVFIAGHFYVIDFVNMCQYRKDNSGRSRRIKRDSPNTSKKGVAGIRLSLLQLSSEANGDEDGDEDSTNDNVSDISDSPSVLSSVISATHRLAPTGNSSSPNSASPLCPNALPVPSQPP